MKNIGRTISVVLMSLVLLILVLWAAMPYWLPGVLTAWLPSQSRVEVSVLRVNWHGLVLPQLRFWTGNCELLWLHDVRLGYQQGWRLNVQTLKLDNQCFSQLPVSNTGGTFRLNQWQGVLPQGSLHIDELNFTGFADYAGTVNFVVDEKQQRLSFQGDKLDLQASLQGNELKLSRFSLQIAAGDAPLSVNGKGMLTLADSGLPAQGQVDAQVSLPHDWQQPDLPEQLDIALMLQEHSGQLLVNAPDYAQPLLDLPWALTPELLTIYDGRWYWPYQIQTSGRLMMTVKHWQRGRQAQISARMSALTEGEAGKGNVVLNIGPGTLDLMDSALPLRLTGKATYQALQFYVSLPAELQGSLNHPVLRFLPDALLWSRGQIIDGLNIDEVRWPLAGVSLSPQGVNGQLQAILKGYDVINGAFALHLDGKAQNFRSDSGQWQWRYWGQGDFLPLQTKWRTRGSGEWRDQKLVIRRLETDFDQLMYRSAYASDAHLALQTPLVWNRDADDPSFSGRLTLNVGAVQFDSGARLAASQLNFSVNGEDPFHFQFRGDWQAGEIGSARVNGRWDGIRLRGQAWWPAQPLTVFQPLLPPIWKTALQQGKFHAQVAFSVAEHQGLAAAGHAVVKDASAWIGDTEIQEVNFTLPFALHDSVWRLGPREPVMLRVGRVNNPFEIHDLQFDVQGTYPWTEQRPLFLTNMRMALLDGEMSMQQLRLPQQAAALLRVKNIETSKLINALSVKSFALSGRVNGAFPLWIRDSGKLVDQGWISNPGALTLRMDADLINGMVQSNGAAASAINWLRYLEINRDSWVSVNLDREGKLLMNASLQSTGEVDGKRGSVNLDYQYEDNIFALWRGLSFGDNLQNWLARQLANPSAVLPVSGSLEEHKTDEKLND